MNRFSLFTVTVASTVCLGGCSYLSIPNPIPVYRTDVPQGNLITAEMISHVQVGMTKPQVQYVLGEPLVQSPMHQHRWDYAFYFDSQKGNVQHRQVTVFFGKDGRVERIEHPVLPTERQADEMVFGKKTDFSVLKD